MGIKEGDPGKIRTTVLRPSSGLNLSTSIIPEENNAAGRERRRGSPLRGVKREATNAKVHKSLRSLIQDKGGRKAVLTVR